MWCHLLCSLSVVCLPTTLMTLCSLCSWECYLHVNDRAGCPGAEPSQWTGGASLGVLGRERAPIYCHDHFRPYCNSTAGAQYPAFGQFKQELQPILSFPPPPERSLCSQADRSSSDLGQGVGSSLLVMSRVSCHYFKHSVSWLF